MPDVVLPALNEAEALPWVLERMPAGFRPIVVDNGSDDGTAEVARRLGAIVVVEAQRGFGAACWAGLERAESDVVCFMDADASFDPGELPVVAGPVEDGTVDLMLGARRATRGAWPLHARVANRFLAREIRRRSGVRVSDLGPMRAARRVDLLALGMVDRRSGWPLEMLLRGARAGWRVDEVAVSYRPRIGRSKVTGTVLGTVRAVKDMGRLLAASPDTAPPSSTSRLAEP
ncbi:MAG: glycosyltransferase family 2 protein [Acidimicrobiia bacterium]|nr:glycosyltransferase family 2 protein [Acidimicrobiia bacterium]